MNKTDGFKQVTFCGFDSQPELLHQAETATAILTAEVTKMRQNVSVLWEPASDSDTPLRLSLTLELPTGVGKATAALSADDFENADQIAYRLRRVWQSTLSSFMDGALQRLDALSVEPAEVA